MSKFVVTATSKELLETIRSQLLSSGLLRSSGAELALEKVASHGKRLGWMLILKLPLLNGIFVFTSGGTDTEDINTWLWTSFEEKLELDTCYVGSTDTRFAWKQKGIRSFCRLHQYGLQAIYRPMNGIRS